MTENKDYDVIEMDFPEYEESYPALAEAETDISFILNKEEVYKRNRIIAAEKQAEQLVSEEKAKEKRRAEFENIYKEAQIKISQTKPHGYSIKIPKPDISNPWWAILKAIILLMAMTAFAFIMAEIAAPFIA